jgi:hypothetical protein
MAYAVIIDPGAINSPDLPAYQADIYGCLNPTALILLQMREVDLHVDVAVTCAKVTLHAR